MGFSHIFRQKHLSVNTTTKLWRIKILLLITGLCLIGQPPYIFAGVTGSDHDLTGGGQKLCEACHTPHNAQGAALWSAIPTGTFTGVQDLCYTCHDGSVTAIGLLTAFNSATEQHLGVGSDCSGEGACHNVHSQNPNVSGRFLVVSETNNSYCETCHNDTPFPGAIDLGDHTAGISHLTKPPPFTCNQCHTVHGATPQTTNPFGLTNPILLGDNQPGAYYGAFCISCHKGIVPDEAVAGTGGLAANDMFDYSEFITDGSEDKHPTTAVQGDDGYAIGGCDLCHDVHDPTGISYGYILKANNTNSAYCLSCHDGASSQAVGTNTHYTGVPNDVNMNSDIMPPLPWADQINEDAYPGFDWPDATPNAMVCETCHSVHRAGWSSVGSGYFLRHSNGNLSNLCTACHTNN